MSKKPKTETDIVIVRNRVADDVRSLPANQTLYLDGSEVQAGKSLAVTAYLPSLGDRIKRYMRTPQLEADKLHDKMLWDDDDYEAVFGEDDRPRVSVHDELYQEGLTKAQARYDERKKKELDEREQKLKAENEAFQKRVKEIMAETSPNPPPST